MAKVSVAPNPFVNGTTLYFGLDLASDVNLVITDQQGSLIYNRTKHFNGGNNSWEIDELTHLLNGVYFFQLRSGESIFSGKLIKLE